MITFKQFLNEAMSGELFDQIEEFAVEHNYHLSVEPRKNIVKVEVMTVGPKKSAINSLADNPEIQKRLAKKMTVDPTVKPIIDFLNAFWKKFGDDIQFVSYLDLEPRETTETVFTMPVSQNDFMKSRHGKFVFHFNSNLEEAKKDDGVEEEAKWLTPLKSLKDHHYNGRVWISGNQIEDIGDKVLAAVQDPIDKMREGDIVVWHDWMDDKVYEIHFTAETAEAIKRVLDRVRKVTSNVTMATAHVRGNRINHGDWKPYP